MPVGFQFFRRNRLPETPSLENGQPGGGSVPASGKHPREAPVKGSPRLFWRAKEDVYNPVRPSVLLIRAGEPLEKEMVSKLLKQGAHPDQFELCSHAAEGKNVVKSLPKTPAAPPPAAASPIPAKPLSRRVLVLESDEKSLKRMTAALFGAGISMHHIHPLLMAGHLEWGIEKYRPELLILSFDRLSGGNGVNISPEMLAQGGVKRVLLTSDIPLRNGGRLEELKTWMALLDAELLLKPVDRQKLRALLKPEEQNKAGGQ